MTAIPVEPELLLYPHDWTVTQYERMVDSEVLGPDDRVELLFGKIVTKLPIGDRHSFCVQEFNYYMIRNFGDRFIGRQTQPVSLLAHSVPEPDYVLASLCAERYRDRKPTAEEIHLIVEVADSTLSRDRTVKARLYSTAGIAEYWIVNLADNQLEVYTGHDIQEGRYRHIYFYGVG